MLANISYKISVFVDLAHVEAEPKNVIEFLQEFSEYGMMPAVADGSDLGNVKRPKFTFAIENNTKKIAIYDDRIDFLSVANTKEGFGKEDAEDIIRIAADILGRILGKYEKKACRLAVFKEYMLFELNGEECQKFAKEKFGCIPYYENSDIVECGSRVVTRKNVSILEKAEEICNIITMINRVNFESFDGVGAVMKDAFKIDFDLNTFQGNMSARFGKEELADFCKKMDEESICLTKQIVGD